MSTPSHKTQTPSGQPVHPSILLQQVLATQAEHRLLLQQQGAVLEHLAEMTQDLVSLHHTLLALLRQQQHASPLPEMAEEGAEEEEVDADPDDPETPVEGAYEAFAPRRASEGAPLTGEQEPNQVPVPPTEISPMRSKGPAPIEFPSQPRIRRKQGAVKL
ncbi:hypothetical protein KDH_80220 [Dictyobacter sp. S3.2.2.5]|uniref:Transposase TnpC homeodomain domain-containing protein n=1 Tax=Dictyobacter halimunensis TaxID=3026934 RepID=A0ABQ6G5U7_9CHLR|nr:hypothetical protein KDH_80220 [Dictyobacter sp. S3.2.2.5]